MKNNKVEIAQTINLNSKTSALMEALTPKTSNSKKSNILFEKTGKNRTLGVIKHGGKFLIVKINEGNTELISGEKNIQKYIRETLDMACNTVNLMIKEEDRYILNTPVLNTPNQSQAPEQEIPTSEMPNNDSLDNLDSQDQGLDLEDTSDENGQPIETDLEEYQELAGKLAYIAKESSDAPDKIKYILNTIFASLPQGEDLKQVYQSAIEKLTDKVNGEGNAENTADDSVSSQDQTQVEESIYEAAKKHGYIVERIIVKDTLEADDPRASSLHEPDEYYYFKPSDEIDNDEVIGYDDSSDSAILNPFK